MSHPVYIVAEAGVNHNGSVDLAKRLVDAAVYAGADAIKFQTFKTERLVCANAPKAEYQKKSTPSRENQFAMLKKLELSEASHGLLINYCMRKKIRFLSSPFDMESLNLLLKKFHLPQIKIGSGEITNAPLLLHAARSGKPIILSTGMCTLPEIRTALGILAFGYTRSKDLPSRRAFLKAFESSQGQRALKKKVILLHCTTEYPAPLEDVHLRAMDTLKETFGLPVGFSDHTEGIAIPIAAAARGAIVIEKHFTLDRNLPGPDHKASIEPAELMLMVKSIREIELALGSFRKEPTRSELKNRVAARKSLVAARRISRGEMFTEANLSCKRPGSGMEPLQYWNLIGKKSSRDYRKDELIFE